MVDPQVRFQDLITALRDCDYRLTPQRVELVRLIAASEGHPSASQLFEKVRTKFPTMSRATVYKTLTLLKEMNQVLEIDLRDDSHYDGNHPEPHPHLICISCSRIKDASMDLDPLFVTQLEEESGYQITRPQLSFYGYCPACKQDA
ncbi:Fur family transcriptional regulator [Chloroflexota bacterium]